MTNNHDSKDTDHKSQPSRSGIRKLWAKLQAFEARKLEDWQATISPKRAAVLQIIVALVFAGMIILSSYLLRGTDHNQTTTYLLIAIWFVPFSLLASISNGNGCKQKSDA